MDKLTKIRVKKTNKIAYFCEIYDYSMNTKQHAPVEIFKGIFLLSVSQPQSKL